MASRIPSWMLLVPFLLAGFTLSSAQPPSFSGPSVTVNNDASNPVPVTVAPAATFAREPFFISLFRAHVGLEVDLTVPPDKIFVIESIVAEGLIGGGLDRSRLMLWTRPVGEQALSGPTVQYVPIVFERAGQPTTDLAGVTTVRAIASLTTRLYAGPSHELSFAAPQAAPGLVEASIGVSGYFIPANSPTLAP